MNEDSHLNAALIDRDKRGLLGNLSVTVSGQAAAFVAGFICTLITARLIGPEGYGQLSIFFMLYMLLSQLLVAWPNLGMVRFGREALGREGRMADAFWARVCLLLPTMATAVLLLLCFRAPINRYMGFGDRGYLLLIAYICLNEVILVTRAVYQSASRFRAYGLVLFGVRGLKLPVIVLAFLILKWKVGTAEIILAHLTPLVLVVLCATLLLPWRLLLPVRTRMAVLWRVVRYSWPLMLGGLSLLIVAWIDLVVIKHFRTDVELGQYAICYQPVTVISLLCAAFVGTLLPLLVSLHVGKRHDTLIWYVDKALPQAAWGIGASCLVASVCAEAIPFALGAEYAQAVAPCQVLMAGVAFWLLSSLQMALAQAMDRVRACVAAMTVLATLNVFLDLVLVPRIGMLGAAYATALAFMLSGLLYFPILNSISSVRGERPWRRFLALVGLVPPVAFACVAVLVKSPAMRIIAFAAILLVSAGAVRAMNVFGLSTLDRIEQVRMPGWIRRFVHAFYHIFGRSEELE